MGLVVASPIIIDPIDFARQAGTEINPMIFPVGPSMWLNLIGNADGKHHIFKSNQLATSIVEQDPAGDGAILAHNGAMVCSVNGTRLTSAFWNDATGNMSVVDMDTGTGLYSPLSPDSSLLGTVAFSFGAGVYYKASNASYYFIYPDSADSKLKYKKLTAGVWGAPVTITNASTGTGEGVVYVALDSAERAHIFYNLSGTLTYVQIDATDAVGAPVAVGAGSLFQKVDVLITSDTLNVAWVKGDQTQVLFTTGTPLTGPTFAASTVLDTPTPPNQQASYPALALDGTGVLTAFWVVLDVSFNPGVDLMRYSQLSGTWSAPALFYDAIANPPPADPGYPDQFIHTNQVYWVTDHWFVVTAMENTGGFCVGYILLSPSPAPPASPTLNPGPAGRKPIVLAPNQFDMCLHREYRLFCNIDYEAKGCARLPKCFTVDEKEWGEQIYP